MDASFYRRALVFVSSIPLVLTKFEDRLVALARPQLFWILSVEPSVVRDHITSHGNRDLFQRVLDRQKDACEGQ